MKLIKTIKFILIPSLIFFTAIIVYSHISRIIPVKYWDEVGWIGRSFFFELIIKGDFRNSLWKDETAYDQPILPEFINGLMLYGDYLKQKAIKGADYDMAVYLMENKYQKVQMNKYKKYVDDAITNGSQDYVEMRINKNLAYRARIAHIVIFGLTLVGIYLLTYELFGFMTAIMTTFIIGICDYIISYAIIAQSEGLFLFFFVWGIYTIYKILYKENAHIGLYYLLGLILGLITQTKLNGAMLLLIFNIIALFKRVEFKRLFIVDATAFTTFFLVNPFLWRDPIRNTQLLFSWRLKTAAYQAKLYTQECTGDYWQRLGSIYTHFFKGINNKQVGLIFRNNFWWINHFVMFVKSPIIFLIGLWESLKNNSKTRLFVMIFLMVQIIMGFYLKLSWERYYIHLAPFFISISSVGFIKLCSMITYANHKH